MSTIAGSVFMTKSSILPIAVLAAALAHHTPAQTEAFSGALPDTASLAAAFKGTSEESGQANVSSPPESNRADQRASLWSRAALTGEWDGARKYLADRGLEFTFLYRTDQSANLRGGMESRTGAIHNLDLQLSIDAWAFVGWTGARLFVHYLANDGGTISRWTGDAQMISNLESPRLSKFYQVWIEQAFFDHTFSILCGLYDLNSEFYVTNAATLFLNGSHGIGKELSQAGQNGPSIFPNTGGALRVKGSVNELYLQAAVLDGCPGNDDDPCAASFAWCPDQGVLLVAEGGMEAAGDDDNLYRKFAAGAWWFPRSNHYPIDNRGFYLTAEQEIHREEGTESQGLTVFSRVGFADAMLNEYHYHLGIGFVYAGLLPGREDDMLGVAIAHAHHSDAFLAQAQAGGVHMLEAEVSLEVTYRAQIVPWLVFQPDIQYVIHPSGDPGIPNATVAGARIEVSM
ncbi:MAG: carbohydrate porin [Bacteroidetes bacterium]|nr:carbohydrate porin [Bacteroidota bacterium]